MNQKLTVHRLRNLVDGMIAAKQVVANITKAQLNNLVTLVVVFKKAYTQKETTYVPLKARKTINRFECF